MTSFLIVIIYLAFISLGLPDGLLGSAWRTGMECRISISWNGPDHSDRDFHF